MSQRALECPKCGQLLYVDTYDLIHFRLRPSVYGWWCQVCNHDVEVTYSKATGKGRVKLNRPVKHKRVKPE